MKAGDVHAGGAASLRVRDTRCASVITKEKKGKPGRMRSVTGYKSSIRRAKKTLRMKTIKAALANMTEKRKLLRNTLMATKKDASDREAEFTLLKMRRCELKDQRNAGIDDLWALFEIETDLMLKLGFP